MNKLNIEHTSVLKFQIDGLNFETQNQYISGIELKKLAGIPSDTELLLQIKKPWIDEPILNNTVVDLARPHIESFFTKKNLKFELNGKNYVWYKQWISGAELRKLGSIDAEDEIFLKIAPPYQDELIPNDKVVSLAIPEKEIFYSKPPKVDVLIVNGAVCSWSKPSISYEEVVRLAGFHVIDLNTTAYTVNFSGGPKSNPTGSMVNGDVVKVKNKMVFNVTATTVS